MISATSALHRAVSTAAGSASTGGRQIVRIPPIVCMNSNKGLRGKRLPTEIGHTHRRPVPAGLERDGSRNRRGALFCRQLSCRPERNCAGHESSERRNPFLEPSHLGTA